MVVTTTTTLGRNSISRFSNHHPEGQDDENEPEYATNDVGSCRRTYHDRYVERIIRTGQDDETGRHETW